MINNKKDRVLERKVKDQDRVLGRKLTADEKSLLTFMKEDKMWYTLKECCVMKGLNYKTACNKTKLQPNEGRGCKIGGKKCFRKDYVMNWLFATDEIILLS